MPRETINTTGDNFNIKVGWNKDCEVQVGVAESNDRNMWRVYGDSYRDIIGVEVINLVKELGTSDPNAIGEAVIGRFTIHCGSFHSMWATMNRHELNQLIRVLRRARDSAFGKDE